MKMINIFEHAANDAARITGIEFQIYLHLDIALSNITQIAMDIKDELLMQAIVNIEKAKFIIQAECPYSLDEEVLKHLAVWSRDEF